MCYSVLTGVSICNFIRFIWIQPYFLDSTLEHRWCQAFLQSECAEKKTVLIYIPGTCEGGHQTFDQVMQGIRLYIFPLSAWRLCNTTPNSEMPKKVIFSVVPFNKPANMKYSHENNQSQLCHILTWQAVQKRGFRSMRTHLSGNNRTALPSAVHILWLGFSRNVIFYLYFIEHDIFIEY